MEVASRPDAEELMQDTFLLLWQKRRTLNLVGGSVLPWLLASARYLAANKRRQLTRWAIAPLDESLPSTVTSPEQMAIHRELEGFLRDTIASLDPLDRAITELCLIEGLSYNEAARRLRTTHATVRNRLSRARASMQTTLHSQLREEQE